MASEKLYRNTLSYRIKLSETIIKDKTFKLDNGLFAGERHSTFEKPGPGTHFSKVPIITRRKKLLLITFKIEV